MSSVNMEMQIETTQRFYLTHKIAKIKNSGKDVDAGEERGRTLVGLQAGTIILEIRLAVPKKIGYNST